MESNESYSLGKRMRAFIKSFELTYFQRMDRLFEENLESQKELLQSRRVALKRAVVEQTYLFQRCSLKLPQKTLSLIVNRNIRVEDQIRLQSLPMSNQPAALVHKLVENLPYIRQNYIECDFHPKTAQKTFVKELTRQVFKTFFVRQADQKLLKVQEQKEAVVVFKRELEKVVGSECLDMGIVEESVEFWLQQFKRDQAKAKQVSLPLTTQKKCLFKIIQDSFCVMCLLFHCYSHSAEEARQISRRKFRKILIDTSFYTDEQIDSIKKSNKLFKRAYLFQKSQEPLEKVVLECEACQERQKKQLYPDQLSAAVREQIDFVVKAFIDQCTDPCFYARLLRHLWIQIPCHQVAPFLKESLKQEVTLLNASSYLDRKEQQIYLAKVVNWGQNDSSLDDQSETTTCWHVGECSEAKCPCMKGSSFCNRRCGCYQYCHNLFKGCKCLNSCRFHKCACLQSNKECDPALCGKNEKVCRQGTCSNMSITYQQKKPLIPHQSQICPGFGLYAGRDFEKDEYICEYVGELISNAEGERRGQIADILGESYLYTLSRDQNIDAQNVGSLMKLINNAFPPMANCRPKIIFADSASRIALFASEKIREGQELFFDYGYSEEKQDQLDWLREFKQKYFWMEKGLLNQQKRREGRWKKKEEQEPPEK